MRVPAAFRALVQLLALVVTVAGSAQLLPHACPGMGGELPAAGHGMHGADDTASHIGSAPEAPGAPADCQCVDGCCCVPVVAPQRGDAPQLTGNAVAVARMRIAATVLRITVAVPHLRPFAIGPPATLIV
jgi:hypothetical protein